MRGDQKSAGRKWEKGSRRKGKNGELERKRGI